MDSQNKPSKIGSSHARGCDFYVVAGQAAVKSKLHCFKELAPYVAGKLSFEAFVANDLSTFIVGEKAVRA